MTLLQKLTALSTAIASIISDIATLKTELTDLSTFLDTV